MEYKCPRCGQDVRCSSARHEVAGDGLADRLFDMALASWEWPRCGDIPRSEFPSEVRSKMMMGSVVMIVIALVLKGCVVFHHCEK